MIGLREARATRPPSPAKPFGKPGAAVEAEEAARASSQALRVLQAIEEDLQRHGEQHEREEHRGAEQEAHAARAGSAASCGAEDRPVHDRLRAAAQQLELHGVAGPASRDRVEWRAESRTGRPSTATMRSPARSPAASAGVSFSDRPDLHRPRPRAVLDVEAQLDHPLASALGRGLAVAEGGVFAQREARPEPATRDPRRRESRRRAAARSETSGPARHARYYGSPRPPTSSASGPRSRGPCAGRCRRASGARRGPPGARRPRRPWSGRGSPGGGWGCAARCRPAGRGR